MITSRNSATWGWKARAAIRAPPRSCGFTTRSAPAWTSLPTAASLAARDTMNRPGAIDRAVNVT